MQDIKYLLSIEGLLKEAATQELYERCFRLLDEERRSRAQKFKVGSKKAESVGAGLLLQLAVGEALKIQEISEVGQEKFTRLTLSEVLAKLEQNESVPVPLEYTYGENGKPYFKNLPFYFNISHSGEYVCCVLSGQEIGVDIQSKNTAVKEKIAQRFFAKEEVRCMEQCENQAEWQNLFYKLWTRKEAYGKLTGKGLVAVIGENLSDTKDFVDENESHLHMMFEEYEIDNYQIAVCKWKH